MLSDGRISASVAGLTFTVKLEELDVASTDPRVKEMREKVKAFAKEQDLSNDEAQLLHPQGLAYMWQQSHRCLKGLKLACSSADDWKTVALFSHGAQIELRFIRMILLANGIFLEEQNRNLVSLSYLDQYDGLLGTAEAFTYDLAITSEGKIIFAANFGAIRLPQYPG